MLTVGSLFSGIGGLDLGLERAGMIVKWQSETDQYASKVLEKHWPSVPNLGDVTTIEWETVERVDLICGGYPCQPFSLAGGRKGPDDSRHLWPYFADALRVLRPRWALLENVPGHLSLGFDAVLGDLARLGFDAEWDCIPAAAVGAPHLRYRVFVVAHSNRESESERTDDAFKGSGVVVPDSYGSGLEGHRGSVQGSRELVAAASGAEDRTGVVADTNSSGLPVFSGSAARAELDGFGTAGRASRWESEPDVGGTLDGFSTWLDGSDWESGVARVAHGVPHRMDRLRTLGNAVVPQVAEFVGRRILEVS